MTANLTSEYYSSTRDFLVLDTKPADVSAIAQVFNADFAHRPVQPGDGKDLVWSPTDSQAKLLETHRRRDQEPAHLQRGNGRHHDRGRAHQGGPARRGRQSVRGEPGRRVRQRLLPAGRRRGAHQLLQLLARVLYPRETVEADYGTGHAKVFIGSENSPAPRSTATASSASSPPARRCCPRSSRPSPMTTATASTGLSVLSYSVILVRNSQALTTPPTRAVSTGATSTYSPACSPSARMVPAASSRTDVTRLGVTASSTCAIA